MRSVTELMCWSPECSTLVEQKLTGRPKLYCSATCRQRAFRRNGGKAPSEPYPPLLPADRWVPPPPKPAKKSPPAARTPRKRAVRSKPPAETPPVSPEADGAEAGADGLVVGSAPADGGGTVTQLHIAVTEDATVPVVIRVHPMVAQYTADLERMGIAETRQGLHIIAMAEKLVSSATSASAATNVSKELERLMAAAEQNTPEAQIGRDPSVSIRERTIAKLRALAEHVEATG
jgi:hypothetical protein